MVIRRRGKIIFFVVLTILICTLMIIVFNSFKKNNSFFSVFKENKPKTYNDRLKNTNNDFKNTLKPESSVKIPEKGSKQATSSAGLDSREFDNLRIQMEEMCKNKGVWSIYIKDLKSGEHLSINNRKMVAASLIKVFIMAKTYQEIYEGDIEKNREVSEMLKKMITISHNESSNKLVEILGDGSHKSGMKVVNKFAISIDCMNTEQQRDMKDSRPIPVPGENYTSVEDCAKLLEKIYNKRCVSPEFDKEMMNLMLAQERNTKLPALIPKGIKIAHKTGELAQTENDVGIVFGPKTDYIICVMSNEVKNTAEARNLISQISKVVYDYFKLK
jgi:beta-lactamase class A